MLRVAIVFAFWIFFQSSNAQVTSNRRVKTIELKSDTTVFDTLPVADFRLLSYASFDSLSYTINAINASIMSSQRGMVTISYRVLFDPFHDHYFHKDRKAIQRFSSEKGYDYGYIPSHKNREEEESGLSKSGVISRGISIGNNQDLVLNSIFNLQLSGKLNSEWNVLGSISDDNTQLQPDGTTLQLQEFDKVFIKLYNEKKQAIVGDFELKPDVSQSYFMNYYKRNRGVYFTSKDALDSLRSIRYAASIGAAKGRYARQTVPVVDGNQGPYRLKGSNGELYLLINAGSERIYLDDKLLLRGYDNDYTIDYNTGEILFTSRRLIIATSRVAAEFQYTDRNYSRAVMNSFVEWEQDRLNVRLHYYSEKDLKNQPVLLDLNDAQKQKLAAVGDRVNEAYSSSAKEIRLYTVERILYRKVDTLGYFGVFVLAIGNTNDTVFYEVVFNEVGENKGNYRLLKSDMNGKVYHFMPPINGVLQGNAEPLLPLIAPQTLQNISLGVDYKFNRHQRISVELAGSNYDKNDFSKKDKNDDYGYAAHTQWEQHFMLSKKEKPLELNTITSFDYLNKNFKGVERFRDINFARTWNRQLQQVSEASSPMMEYNTKFNLQFKKASDQSLQLGVQQYRREKEQDGILYNAVLDMKQKNTTCNASWELMQNKLQSLNSRNNSLLSNIGLMQQLNKTIAVGAEAKQESSRFLLTGSDTLQAQSFFYSQGLIYVKWLLKSSQFKIDFLRRNDDAPLLAHYSPSFSTNIFSANGLLQFKKQMVQFQAQFKTLEIHNLNLTNLKNDQGITFQIHHSYQSDKHVIQHNLQANAGSGQEQRRIYTFFEVPAGRGSYAWRDYNGDGIKQLNEFEQAYNPDETKYVRVLIPTQDFSKVNYFALYETFVLQPYKVWSSKTGIKKMASKFENRLTYKNELKQYAQNHLLVTPWSPVNNDTSLISNNFYLENNLIFNHPFNRFDLHYNYRRTGNTSLLSYGLDSRNRFENELVMRYTFNTISFLQCYLLDGMKQFNSQFFAFRNYRYHYQSFEPKLNLEIERALRITLRSKYFIAKGNSSLDPKTETIEAGLDLHWYLSSQSFMDGRVNFVRIKFSGDQNSTVAYEMLQGLNNGNNILIYLTFLHQLSSTMQLNLNYNGRAAQGKSMIHTGGVEVRYLF